MEAVVVLLSFIQDNGTRLFMMRYGFLQNVPKTSCASVKDPEKENIPLQYKKL